MVTDAFHRCHGFTPREWQLHICSYLLKCACRPPSPNPQPILIVRTTAGGKSAVRNAVGLCTAGVTITVVPLLSLSADQATKLQQLKDSDTSVRVYNLDAIRNFRANQRIRQQLLSLDDDTSLSIFLFCSPQKITKDPMWSLAIEQLVARGIVCLVAVDECHLFANFGIEFCAECYHLKEHLFSKLHLAPINIPIVFYDSYRYFLYGR